VKIKIYLGQVYDIIISNTYISALFLSFIGWGEDRLCGLVVRVLGYRSEGPGSIPGTTRKKLVGLERGPLSLVSTTQELLDRKVAAPVYKTMNTAVGICHADHVAPSIRKTLAITSPTSGGCSVGIVRSRTQTMEFIFL
jgi:hypothetical protein